MKNGKTMARWVRVAITGGGAGLLLAMPFPSWAGSSGVLAAGKSHTCGLKDDGQVVCWGGLYYIKPPPGTFTQISGGSHHYCGLKTDGSIACWGKNTGGEASPPPGTYIQISTGYQHSCATKNDGTAICWGDNSEGQLSLPSGVFTQVSAGYEHSCGLRQDGKAECWGDEESRVVTDVPVETFSALSAGYNQTCGLKTDGAGICWGDSDGEESLGFLSRVDVATWSSKICGLKADHGVDCWPNDVDKPSGTFTDIAAGHKHACALKENGAVACWGENGSGQTTPPKGVTFMEPSIQPIPVPQPSDGSCTDTGTDSSAHATFDPSTGELHVPFVDVPGILGGTQTYEIYMIQLPLTFTFDLDMNRVVEK